MSKKSMSVNFRSIALALVSVVVASSLTACSDEEVGTAIGAAAIVGGAVVIANNTHCESGYVTRCTEHRDYWGNYRRTCRDYYDSCAYVVPGHSHDGISGQSLASGQADLMGAIDAREARVNDVNWAVAFGMGIEPAGKLIKALKQTRDGDREALIRLGLTEQDIRRLGSFNMPDYMSVREVAKNINQDVATTERVLQTLIEETRLEVIRRQRAGEL